MLSTFCLWGSDHADTASHARCSTLGCECECHPTQGTGNATMTTNDAVALPPRTRSRRSYTDDQKRAIAREYRDAPAGTKKAVLKRHVIAASLPLKWAHELDLDDDAEELTETITFETIAGDTTGITIETEPASAYTEVAEQRLGVILEGDDEIDIFAALAFLDGLTADELAAQLVTDLIENCRGDADVQACITAKRGRQETD